MSLRLGPRNWIKTVILLVVIWGALAIYWSETSPKPQVHRISELDLSSTASHTTSLLSKPDAADSEPVKDFCSRQGWRPFRPKQPGQRRKVYDLFMINTELDWLEIRLNTTYDYVDYFVVVEAPKTFTGLDKPLVIRDNWDSFAAYHPKLIYHKLEYPPGWDPPRTWDWEDLQRNAMYDQVLPRLRGEQAPAEGDALVVADVDEIPRPEALAALRACDFPRRTTLRSRFYYYSFQFLHRGEEWAHPQATTYRGGSSGGGTIPPVNLRNGDGAPAPLVWMESADLWNAGWHCSSCFATVGELLNKMASFSHVGLNRGEYRDRHRIADRVRAGRDLWDREGQVYDRIEGNTDVPPLLLAQPERFRYLLNRDGKSAGFSDYP
ncbi:Glycosyl transferase family 17 protein [Pleurostoma richardsiae]|uniref:Glycosyl transferase family 17 protein n=1 Tax=Pleurostoma richardsiae TaxID=41990 RepID=A0AA38RJP5_9PEZI|nr:Glycosyl transferase family 17 protein [Pleurostoma richardsiae]